MFKYIFLSYKCKIVIFFRFSIVPPIIFIGCYGFDVLSNNIKPTLVSTSELRKEVNFQCWSDMFHFIHCLALT